MPENKRKQMIVRPATETDMSALCRLLNDIIDIGGTTAFEFRLDEAEFTTIFLSGDACYSCLACELEGGKLAGFQALSRKGTLPANWVDIATFARTEPKVGGVGTALFKATLAFLESTDAVAINATIRADNQPGLSYYAKMGFDDYHVDKAVPMNDGTPMDRISKRYLLGTNS